MIRCVSLFARATASWLLALTCLVMSSAEANDEEILFNGESLSGWSGDTSVWSVEDNTITGTNSADDPIEHNTFLVWQGEDIEDFALELEYRIVGGNSGIQYRSHLTEGDRWVVGGYQADIEDGTKYPGILYGEHGRGSLGQRGQRVIITETGRRSVVTYADSNELLSVIKFKDWNSYKIEAVGQHLRHTINGQLMCEVIDRQKEGADRSGLLALQVHSGPPMKVQFRNIRLKRKLRKQVTADEADAHSVASHALPAADLTLLPGFRAELIYSVPRSRQGSWVALTVDPDGRLTVSDQGGFLYRVTPPAVGDDSSPPKVEKLDVFLGSAQGLTWLNGDLYAVTNGMMGQGVPDGLYRVRDTDGDGELDDGRLLRNFSVNGEHGAHGVVPGPDGKSLYMVAGNYGKLPELDKSRVPQVWDEDQLLPRLWDAGGHAVGILAPGGRVLRTDLDGKSWELISSGYRNPYDLAFSRQGELMTFDADMEWDVGAPWYRPIRVCHVVSGSDYGWRSGTGKWPVFYPDTLPPVVDTGTGSPTGVSFAYGAKFPQKYQDALYICDWSFGKLYAIHLKPQGATFMGKVEGFLTGAPLPLTDVVIHPRDGALYFTVGGRDTQSGLYRVTYVGTEVQQESASAIEIGRPTQAAVLRRSLEKWHGRRDTAAVGEAWPHLGDPDRFIRYAARVAIESQPIESWQEKALAEMCPAALIEAMVALARHGDRQNEELPEKMIESLGRLKWSELSNAERLGLLRAVGLMMIRLAEIDEDAQSKLVQYFDPYFPAEDARLNQELCRLLVRLKAPDIVAKSLTQLDSAPTQEEQIHYILVLRALITAAPAKQQQEYFAWFHQAGSLGGGHSLAGFLKNIKQEVVDGLDDQQRERLADVLSEPTDGGHEPATVTRSVVKKYSIGDVAALVQSGFQGRDFERGRHLYATANCFKCHRLGPQGGATGPDLTTVGRRFNARDLAEAIVEPNKVVSDRFRMSSFELEDGRVIIGRIANMVGDDLHVVTDMTDPDGATIINRNEVELIQPVAKSAMPAGLLDTFTEHEILDLLAFIVSGGQASDAIFQ